MAGSPSIASLFAQRIIIGVGDLAVSNNTEVILSTYALGSCIGVVAFDPAVRVGGILHLMLPESSIAPEKAARQPAMFADTGMHHFFRELAGFKAQTWRLKLLVAGGACVLSGTDTFRIGERNVRATLDLLASSGCRAPLQDVGGFHNRTLHLDMNTACVTLKTPQSSTQFPFSP
ncbi:MAG TPA: chemotaxis protein CheD [Opitutaceae bacterium]|nr:chemotaxis protein CheD [Opitutaceae bacterium]